MYKIPKFNLSDVIPGAPDTPHPMFIINGEVKDAIYVGKYLSTVWNERAYSLPGKDPKTNLPLADAQRYAYNKGEGWHVMTNAERAGLALLCKSNNYMPYGNTSGGKNAGTPYVRGVPAIKHNKGTYSVGDTPRVAAIGDGEEVQFNISNAKSLALTVNEGASIDGTTYKGTKSACTVDADVMAKVKDVSFFVNKRSNAALDNMTVLNGINSTTSYNKTWSAWPSVIKDGNVYRMWFLGGDGTNAYILYSESTDMYDWTTPMLVKALGACGTFYTNMGLSVLKIDGVYKMWYSTAPTNTSTGAGIEIDFCNSIDGINWTDGITSMRVSSSSYNTFATYNPHVQRINGQYMMWFIGITANGAVPSALYSTSMDGKNWSAPVIAFLPSISTYAAKGFRSFAVLYTGTTYRIWATCIDANSMYNVLVTDSNIAIQDVTTVFTLSLPSGFLPNNGKAVGCSISYNRDMSAMEMFVYSEISSAGAVMISDMDGNGVCNYMKKVSSITPTGACMIKESDGTYKMWYYVSNSILYTTSVDGIVWASPVTVLPAGIISALSPILIMENRLCPTEFWN
jgi:hypothetical protein